MQTPFAQYADPYQGYDHRIDDLILQTHANAVIDRLASRLLDANADRGLVGFVANNISALKESFEPFWDVSFGRAQRCLEDDTVSAEDTLCLLAFRMAQFGAHGHCSGHFSQPVRLIGGNTLLPPMDSFDIASDENTFLITGSLKGRQAFVLEKKGGVLSVHESPGIENKQFERVCGLMLLSGDAVLDDVILEDDFHSIFSYPDINHEILAEYQGAFTILEKVPEYEQWVRRILRGIVVCETDGSRTRSSSWSEAPGLVLVSRSNADYLLAEMLVHEASHQYHNLLTRCGDTVVAGDNQLYFSPAVERPRPLRKVLLGYHAFGNMFLFYNKLEAHAGKRREEIRQTINMLNEKLYIFEEPLLRTEALSEIGQALFHPLYESVSNLRG